MIISAPSVPLYVGVPLVLLAIVAPAVLVLAAVRHADPQWRRTVRIQRSATGECVDVVCRGQDTVATMRNASLITATVRTGRLGRPDRITDSVMTTYSSLDITLPGLSDVEAFVPLWRATGAQLRVETVRERDRYVLLSLTDEEGRGVARVHPRYVTPANG